MKYIYNLNDGNKDMKPLLGSKGANLAEMCVLNMNVPKGFVITTEACNDFLLNKEQLNKDVVDQIIEEIKTIEATTSKTFGRSGSTLLFSVRSGAPVSMPGMMDTILNIGLNDTRVVDFATETGNAHMAYDCYRRLISMYGNVVKGINMHLFDDVLKKQFNLLGKDSFDSLETDELKTVIEEYKSLYLEVVGEEFPQNVGIQLLSSVEAVFSSWNNERAQTYRNINNISNDLGTAVVIQEMVFGNYNERSATGVIFSRNPNTGKPGLYGEYLVNAQGEDIVSGVRTPKDIEELEEEFPSVFNQLSDVAKKLENYYNDMQDIEFTVEDGILYILQTRNAQRSNKAKVCQLLEKYRSGLLSDEDFVEELDVEDVKSFLFNKFDESAINTKNIFANGLPASAGAITGLICLNEESVLEALQTGKTPVLVRTETSANDVSSMHKSAAIVTALGGMTSHAAVVARGMGKCCVCGVSGLEINEKNKTVRFNNQVLSEGDTISVDGLNGVVYTGSIAISETSLTEEFYDMMKIINKVKEMKVFANADDVESFKAAASYGSDGVGLVRTEHMFFDPKRLLDMQSLIMSDSLSKRVEYLKIMSKYQIEDFISLLDIMEDKVVSIRLLDPPLHEFLPKKVSQAKVLAEKLGLDLDVVKNKIKNLKEINPMLGHRGSRLAITYPEIYQMQVESIVTAVVVRKNSGFDSNVKIILPLITDENELVYLKKVIETTTKRLLNGQDVDINIELGVMIETPRAALISERLANHVDFFSYGTNDLTQLTYGFSRDDTSKFLPAYYEKHIIKSDPFVTLDKLAVGKLVILSNQFGKISNPNLITGICGEHGSDYDSVVFAYNIGLDYVSCTPRNIPLAKLAAAKAVLKAGGTNE